MKLDVFVGSITDPALGVDAIVNASNPQVALGSGVSAAIRAACGGADYQDELRQALLAQVGKELGPGDCLVTGAGTSTAFRWVLHVPAVDYGHPDPETAGATGPSRIRSCTTQALEAARELHRGEGRPVSLALPLLGAGAGGLGPATSAEALLGAVRAFLERHGQEAVGIDRLVIAVLSSAEARLVEETAARFALAVHGGGPSSGGPSNPSE